MSGFSLAKQWMKLSPSMLPFADAATDELPLSRLLRLSLFQVSVGMAAVLLIGTLNRVMIVELFVPAWLVAVMVALPLIPIFMVLIGLATADRSAADNAAVADIVATTTTRDVPKTAYSTSAGIAAYRPTTGGTPAIVA